MNVEETKKYLAKQLSYHRSQVTHFEREIKNFQAAVDAKHSPDAVSAAQRQIKNMQGHIESHQHDIAKIEAELARISND